MPPQLRLIENEQTGEQGLWNPETQSLFDPKDYRVIEHETGQQALFDPVGQSIIAYLPKRTGKAPSGAAQAITEEYPVEYAGRAGATPYKPPIAEGGRYGEGAGAGERAFRNLMGKAEVATSALSRLAPTGVTEPVIAETVKQIEEGEEGMIGRILRQSGAISPQAARSIGASIPGRAADVLFSVVTALTPKTVTDLISGVIEKAEEVSPGSGPMIERLMLALPAARFGRATKPGIRSVEDLKPRRTVEAEKIVREEPAFVEALREERTVPMEARAPITEAPIEPAKPIKPSPETPDISLTKEAAREARFEESLRIYARDPSNYHLRDDALNDLMGVRGLKKINKQEGVKILQEEMVARNIQPVPPKPRVELTEADLAAQKLFGTRGGVEGEVSPKGATTKLTPLEQEMGHPVTEATFEGIPKGVTGSRLETGTTKLITEAGIEAFKSLGKDLEPDIPVTIQLARAMQRGEVDLRGLERILETKGVSKEQFVESFITTASNAGRQLSQLAKVVKSLKNADAAFGEIGKRLPLYTSILEAGKTFIEKGKLTAGEGSQLARDVIDSIRLNLFSVTSFSLDMIGNATEIGAQVAAGVGKDLVQVAKGHVNFPSLQALIRTIKNRPRVAGVEKGLELTAIGEKLRGGFQKGPGTFTLRSTAVSKELDYLVGSPLYLKGVMDTGAKRFSAAMSIWQDAIMAANLKGLKGAERQNFYQKFWEKPPETVIKKAISEGNKAGFNRTLSKIEEKYASSTVVKLLVDTFGRWPWQFARWGAEMVGYNPELFKAIRQGKASAEDIAGYLTKSASGWGGLYLIDRTLYDHVDFNSMEYVHADGDRTRLSSREPLASALWLLAVIKGDVEKAKGGFKFASVPGAQLLGEGGTPGILGGIIKQAQAAMSRRGTDPRGLSRDLTGFFNRLIPGQAILSAIESVFDPTLREGLGANIPGLSFLKPAVINPATGKPLTPRQEIPGTGIEFPQIGGVPIPGATRKLDPVTKVLSKFGLLVYRGPRQPLAGVPPGEAPAEVRREWLEAFGQKREKLLSPLIPRIEQAEKNNPKEMQPGGRMYEAWRKQIQFYDSIAAKRATAEVNVKGGFRARTKLPRQPTLRELRRPNQAVNQ